MSEELKNIIQKDIEQIYAKHNITKIKSKIIQKKYWVISKILSSIGLCIFLFGILVIYKIDDFFKVWQWQIKSSTINLITIIFVVVGILILIPSIIISIFQFRIRRIHFKVINQLVLSNYYVLALSQLTNNQYHLISIKKQFDIPPLVWPKIGTLEIDNVMNIERKEVKISFGTLINKISKNKKRNDYTRYCYLNILLPQSNTLVATIQKLPFFDSFKKTENTILESIEFAKYFTVKANDQILIRKLLTPKVMVNLVNKVNNNQGKIIPKIEFNNQNITVFWDSFKLKSPSDFKGVIGKIDLLYEESKLANIIYQKIIDDVKNFLECLSWIEEYEII